MQQKRKVMEQDSMMNWEMNRHYLKNKGKIIKKERKTNNLPFYTLNRKGFLKMQTNCIFQKAFPIL